MKEQIVESLGGKRLQVYPHLDEDAPDIRMAGAGYVEALRYWTEGTNPVPLWGVRINIHYSEPMQREDTDELQAAYDELVERVEEARKNRIEDNS